ncbi:hypothetical protein KQX54_014948 [Cotesia glomerata]|uniref:Uncharacterized protein n=1 Tax=Cotesia glomerata TaxID=32391 RepID=A0AAV7ISX8_COTGL|nr:hypothetical protein KQX54_014948 [Cotesia glomerata]
MGVTKDKGRQLFTQNVITDVKLLSEKVMETPSPDSDCGLLKMGSAVGCGVDSSVFGPRTLQIPALLQTTTESTKCGQRKLWNEPLW